jgi:hypothetical protein
VLLLAVLFERGFGSVKPNAALSAQWYSKAIEHSKDRRAQTRLGIAYLEGRGVPQDAAKGKELLLSAAKAGSPEALYRLALLDQPDVQAAQWLSVAAMTDAAYGAAAQAALSKVSGRDQEEIKRRASSWVHAHQLERQLPAFSEPIRSPYPVQQTHGVRLTVDSRRIAQEQRRADTKCSCNRSVPELKDGFRKPPVTANRKKAQVGGGCPGAGHRGQARLIR